MYKSIKIKLSVVYEIYFILTHFSDINYSFFGNYILILLHRIMR